MADDKPSWMKNEEEEEEEELDETVSCDTPSGMLIANCASELHLPKRCSTLRD